MLPSPLFSHFALVKVVVPVVVQVAYTAQDHEVLVADVHRVPIAPVGQGHLGPFAVARVDGAVLDAAELTLPLGQEEAMVRAEAMPVLRILLVVDGH
ncbi:hypothetical protein [Catalinimonas alkaloidigena]|uniref:hypothetical protein n=1 Tax=Catalinimonas alkaloidigena TaxID=1075417 RepID=UPI000B7D7332|nr:hypothetical protein [Catalinimonas alkaloidigena]